ncbi:hypothetical protein L7F22_032943 [Adiantum nelumboides]|nr:hypothetical protein [Adiantum nelumboides]
MRNNLNGAWKVLSLDDALGFLESGPQTHPSVDDFACLIHKCRRSKDLGSAQRLHACMRNIGLKEHSVLGNQMVVMLVEVGSVHDAQQVFDGLDHHDGISWNALIVGYTKSGSHSLGQKHLGLIALPALGQRWQLQYLIA